MMELIEKLISNLGINEDQAKGGVGLIFKMVQDKVGSENFQQIQDAIPEVLDLISEAPENGGLIGALGGLSSMFGDKAGQLGELANLAGGFSKLNLNSSIIGKFVPIILDFVQEKGGDTIKEILEKVLSR